MLHFFFGHSGLLGSQTVAFCLAQLSAVVFAGQHMELAKAGFLHQHFLQQLLEGIRFHHGAQLGDGIIIVQIQHGVAAVEPAVQGVHAADQALGLLHLAHLEGKGVDGSGQLFLGNAVFHQHLRAIADGGLQLGGIFIFHILQRQHHVGLDQTVIDTQGHILAQAGFQHGPFQRGIVGATEHIAQHLAGQSLGLVGKAVQNLAHNEPGLGAAVIHSFICNSLFPADGGLGQKNLLFAHFIAAQVFVQQGEGLFHRDVAVQEDPGIGGVIAALIGFQELLIAQVGDHGGVAAGIILVAVVGIHQICDAAVCKTMHGGHGTLHFVEHNAVVG